MNVRSLENNDAKEQQQQRLSKCDRAACDWRKMMICGRPRSRNSKQHTATRTAASSSRTPRPAAILRRATDSWHSVGGEHDERGPLTATFFLISRLLPAPLPCVTSSPARAAPLLGAQQPRPAALAARAPRRRRGRRRGGRGRGPVPPGDGRRAQPRERALQPRALALGARRPRRRDAAAARGGVEPWNVTHTIMGCCPPSSNNY